MEGLIPKHDALFRKEMLCPQKGPFVGDSRIANKIFHDELHCCIRHSSVRIAIEGNIPVFPGNIGFVHFASVSNKLKPKVKFKYFMFRVSCSTSCVERNQPTAPSDTGNSTTQNAVIESSG